jgi:hypothetical protein
MEWPNALVHFGKALNLAFENLVCQVVLGPICPTLEFDAVKGGRLCVFEYFETPNNCFLSLVFNPYLPTLKKINAQG